MNCFPLHFELVYHEGHNSISFQPNILRILLTISSTILSSSWVPAKPSGTDIWHSYSGCESARMLQPRNVACSMTTFRIKFDTVSPHRFAYSWIASSSFWLTFAPTVGTILTLVNHG